MRLPRQFVSSSKLISFHISLARLCEILEKICNGEEKKWKWEIHLRWTFFFIGTTWKVHAERERRRRAAKRSRSMNGYGSMTNGIQWVNERQKPSLRHGELIDFRIGRLKQLRDIGQARTVHRIALGMISRSGQIARSCCEKCVTCTHREERARQVQGNLRSSHSSAEQSAKKRANNKHQTIS